MSKKALHRLLGRDLLARRRAAAVSQFEMARRLGCSVPTVRLLETGAGILATFVQMAKELDLVLDGDALPGGAGVGQSLAALRRRRGISRRGLSLLCRVSTPTVASLENGGDCRVDKLTNIAATLGVNLRLRPASEPRAFFSTVAKSSAHDAWTTPANFLERLYPVVGGRFTLDPCSPTRIPASAPVRASLYYTRDDDGLSLEWTGTVFMNPPYGRSINDWVRKAYREVRDGRVTSLFALLPARTDTRWWCDNIGGVADIWFLRGRLRFGGKGGCGAPFASALVVWGLDEELRMRTCAAFPRAMANHVAPDGRQDLLGPAS